MRVYIWSLKPHIGQREKETDINHIQDYDYINHCQMINFSYVP
jgi:hypothetical protein